MLRKPTVRIALPVAILVAIFVGSMTLAVWLVPWRTASDLVPFRSYDELAGFLDRPDSADYLGGRFSGGGVLLEGPGTGVPGFTPTNVQVEGIDEPDIAKTDGTHLYLVAGLDRRGATAGEVVVVRADPPTDMSVVARLSIPDALGLEAAYGLHIPGVFADGSRLVVLASYATTEPRSGSWYSRSTTAVLVYDLPVDSSSAPAQVYEVSGFYVSARMASSHVYLISNDYAAKEDDVYRLPAVCDEGGCASLPVDRIYHDPTSRDGSTFTNVLAIRLADGATEAISVVTGYASVVYMSYEALYLSFFKWEGGFQILADRGSVSEWTTIHKIRIDGLSLLVGDTADVPGRVLNQFSLDEHRGYLRVATTTWSWTSERARMSNNVYVLDDSLRVVGRLEGLAPGESVYSSRFLGDRGFLVTFEKIDPFFVIDLSIPTVPRVLGSLKVSGYSDYLHILDERHVIGLGKETVPDESGGFSWYQGLKLSLFDITDVGEPREVARYLIGDRGTESEALRDHHAFTFLADRGVLAIPVDLAVIEPTGSEPLPPWTYGTPVWQGAYVISVSAADGFELLGRITHLTGADPYDVWSDWHRHVRRSVHIGEYLYTVSPTVVKAHASADLLHAGTLEYRTVDAAK